MPVRSFKRVAPASESSFVQARELERKRLGEQFAGLETGGRGGRANLQPSEWLAKYRELQRRKAQLEQR